MSENNSSVDSSNFDFEQIALGAIWLDFKFRQGLIDANGLASKLPELIEASKRSLDDPGGAHGG